jgi:hypothetical protein
LESGTLEHKNDENLKLGGSALAVYFAEFHDSHAHQFMFSV